MIITYLIYPKGIILNKHSIDNQAVTHYFNFIFKGYQYSVAALIPVIPILNENSMSSCKKYACIYHEQKNDTYFLFSKKEARIMLNGINYKKNTPYDINCHMMGLCSNEVGRRKKIILFYSYADKSLSSMFLKFFLTKICQYCYKELSKTVKKQKKSLCSRCKRTYYCSRTCQKKRMEL